MPRNINSSLLADLAKAGVRPFYLCDLQLASGWQYCWSGVGPLVWNGHTYSGLGELAEVGAVHESSGVQADGTTISLNVAPSQLDIPPLPAGVTPPDMGTPPAGQSLAWSFATIPPTPVDFANPPSIYNGGLGCAGHGDGTRYSGSAAVVHGDSLGVNSVTIQWSGFARPLEIPAGARIRSVIPVALASFSPTGGGPQTLNYSVNGVGHTFSTSGGMLVGGNTTSWAGVLVSGFAQCTIPGYIGTTSVDVSFLGLAVYYDGAPLTKTSLLYEALNDVRVGGRAILRFGLLNAAGAIVGAPFPVYDGLVDEPTIDDDPAGLRGAPGVKIVLALENRLRNHARAGGRRYTAADQKLDWPLDSGFNWVEILNEISLRWGG